LQIKTFDRIIITGLIIFFLSLTPVNMGYPGSSGTAEGRNRIKLPEPITNPAVVKHNDLVYILGGINERGPQKTVRIFSLGNQKWDKLSEMKEERFGHGAIYHNGRIYVFGGLQNREGKMITLSSVESIDIKTGIWQMEENMPLPRARFGLAYKSGKVYLFGGLNDKSSTLSSVQEFDFNSRTWSEKTDLPLAINRLSAVTTTDGTIYVLGGEDSSGEGLSSVFKYNPSEDTFTAIAPLNDERKNFAIASKGNQIVVTGGWSEVMGNKKFLSSTEIFNPYSRKWERGPSLNIGRDGNRSVIWHDELVVFGGYSGSVLTSIETIKLASFLPGWIIDGEINFHLAFLPKDYNISSTDMETPLSVGFTQDFLPDISNINLADIKGLGFTLPEKENPEKYNLYLKLFRFPESFDVNDSTLPVMASYHMDKIEGAESLTDFLEEPENVLVKMAFIAPSDEKFSPSNPFPSLKVDKKGGQKNFNDNMVFYSLYVKPGIKKETFNSNNERAEWSSQGVLSFHAELIEAYRDNLIEVSGTESETYYYFMDIKDEKELSVLKVPKNPMVFKNWAELPMPNDPSHIFLSGLLLVFKTDYTENKPCRMNEKIWEVDSSDFLKYFSKTGGTIFELGSVVRIPWCRNR